METLRKINLGCGPHRLEGWDNYDLEAHDGVVQRDLSQGLGKDIPGESIGFAYSEHFLEHLHFDQGALLLRDVFRALAPAGVLRLSMPDLNTLVTDYRSNRLDRFAGVWEPRSACSMMNEGMRLWGHQYLYDESELLVLLTLAGFSKHDIYRVEWHKSNYSTLRDLEVRPFRGDLIFEAVKPPAPPVGPSYHAPARPSS